ncbi:hypothetical protein [Phytohabitans rumicis]|uniref:Uncharacterized protein n=1 Tax=Phytohabitans rumicis TaxID=1076125 RepID=A0A6V8LF03_9ACTN|nr:hypothetical protein [Phytohabitans rumicis]GFJ92656.1 hypothetical protein Prum_062980 [Phytohabitans rumicis]
MDRAAPSRPSTDADPLEAVRHTPLSRISRDNVDLVNVVRRRVLRAAPDLVTVEATPFQSAI